MKVCVLALALVAGSLVGCKSGEKAPEGQQAAKCQCPEGKCQCKECQAGDMSHCSCATKAQ
jgi:hypothetical protein